MFETPILLIIFNRESTAMQVFNAIKLRQPKYLYIAANAARPDILGEKEICEHLRQSILNQIDWDCEVKTLFRTKNLEVGNSLSSAITWFFEHVEEGIVLEDDCLPHPDFFEYCATLLEKFRDEVRIMSITGSNLHNGKKFTDSSYFFESMFGVWGWASWRRAWKYYNFEKKFTRFELQQLMESNDIDPKIINFLQYQNFLLNNKLINTWDYQFYFAHLEQKAYCVYPCMNLIENLGFNDGANFSGKKVVIEGGGLTSSSLFPLIHNHEIVDNKEAALDFYYKFWNYSWLRMKVKYTLRCMKLLKRFFFNTK